MVRIDSGTHPLCLGPAPIIPSVLEEQRHNTIVLSRRTMEDVLVFYIYFILSVFPFCIFLFCFFFRLLYSNIGLEECAVIMLVCVFFPLPIYFFVILIVACRLK